jgi:GTP-binding protein
MTSYGAPFVLADIPGLISGAHKGIGLGIQFLKHIVRTRFLIHLIDASTIDIDKPLEGYQAINEELKEFNNSLVKKPQIVVLNKLDLPDTRKKADAFQKAFKKQKILCISAATGEGIDRLISRIENELGKINEEK